ncbi:VacJ family lipoprotein [Noviherbaspirillum sp. DKR-6]|uniref:VacJ family lipoprotein n=1 Tax=Noviherbaspirillum pedocola TaxID=2801341 RepID=A0A934SU05_9BURK|nr:VacJ family lipoprotein [Noviherbaspirillum pedocola]
MHDAQEEARPYCLRLLRSIATVPFRIDIPTGKYALKNAIQAVLAAGLAAALSGCATTDTKNPADPLEGYNRAMFNVNDKIDRYALKPAATAYQKVLPGSVQTGINNFFGNLGDVWTAVNNLLQGRGADGVSDIMRFAVNSTLGLFGFLDIASEAGLQKHKQDFGVTLGVWGVGSGPYLVLPFFGSSTIRDAAALPVDFEGYPWQYVQRVDVRNTGTVVRIIDTRASLLSASNLLEEAALDRYAFVRDAYLQRRASKISGSKERGADAQYRPLPDDSGPASEAQNPPTPKPGAASGAESSQEPAPAPIDKP